MELSCSRAAGRRNARLTLANSVDRTTSPRGEACGDEDSTRDAFDFLDGLAVVSEILALSKMSYGQTVTDDRACWENEWGASAGAPVRVWLLLAAARAHRSARLSGVDARGAFSWWRLERCISSLIGSRGTTSRLPGGSARRIPQLVVVLPLSTVCVPACDIA